MQIEQQLAVFLFTLAMQLEYELERARSAGVVKPIWLLTMRWMLPPTL